MAFAYRIGPDDGTLCVTISGDVSLAELRGGLQKMTADPALPDHPVIVSDHRDVVRAASLDHVDAVLDHFRDHRDKFAGARWAMVISLPESYGMMRVLSALTEMRNDMVVRVFDDYDEAVAWVGAPARTRAAH